MLNEMCPDELVQLRQVRKARWKVIDGPGEALRRMLS